MQLSIIIVNWNTRDLLEKCLASISDTIGDIVFEIIVVDNASTDSSKEMVRNSFPQVRLMENKDNLGFARANNQAIQASNGEYLLLLNSDTIILPGTLDSLISFIDENPRAAVIGVQCLNPDLSFQSSYNDFPYLISEFLLASGLMRLFNKYSPSYPAEKSQNTRECDWVGGACMLVRKAAIDQVGLLDENYFMYVEETDWCYRMKKAGWKIYYLPEAKIIHYGGQSADRTSTRQQMHLYRSKWLFFSKHRGYFQARVFGVVVRLSAVVKSIYWSMVSFIDKNSRGKARERAQSHWSVAFLRDLKR